MLEGIVADKCELTAQLMMAQVKVAAYRVDQAAEKAQPVIQTIDEMSRWNDDDDGNYMQRGTAGGFRDIADDARSVQFGLLERMAKCENRIKAAAKIITFQCAVVKAASKIAGEIEQAECALKLAALALETIEEAVDEIQLAIDWGDHQAAKLADRYKRWQKYDQQLYKENHDD
jgi:hypothetical protein